MSPKAANAEKVVIEENDGPELLEMPPDDRIGIYEKFTHPDQEYGWLRDRIMVQEQEGPGGGEPIPVSVNGFRCDIPRGVECDIARPFTDALRSAIEGKSEYREINGKQEPVIRNVPRFHWSVVKAGVNFSELKEKAKAFVKAENDRRLKAWETSKNGDNA